MLDIPSILTIIGNTLFAQTVFTTVNSIGIFRDILKIQGITTISGICQTSYELLTQGISLFGH